MNYSIEDVSYNDGELNNFLTNLGKTSPSILGYHFPFYRNMLEGIGIGKPFYLGARRNGKLVGLLEAFTRESSGNVVYSSLPYFGINSGVLCDNTTEALFDIHTNLLHALLDCAEDAQALSCSIYTPFKFDDFQIYDKILPEAIVVDKFTQYLDLRSTIWERGALGRNLRKAQREGIVISKEILPESIDMFYSIYEQNCLDFGIPLKPKKCVEMLTQPDIIGKHTDIYFAMYEGEMIGGLLVIWSIQTASYYIPCSLTSFRTLQPGVLLIDQAMQDAKAHGIRFWNWEGSPSRDSGVYQFKKKWGSIEIPYKIYVQAYQTQEKFQQLGKEYLASHFPFYFVYPFNLL